MSNLSTYYSFNLPDVNLSGQITNWVTGSPVYDASLNGTAYVSKSNYKIGNGSLEIPKNSFTTSTALSSGVALAASNYNVDFSISSDRLTIIYCGYGSNGSLGTVYYKVRASARATWTNLATYKFSNVTGSNDVYYKLAMTPDKSYVVFAKFNGFIYFTKDPSFNGVTGYNTYTQTRDLSSRNYYGIAITQDGSRIVALDINKVYYANWDVSNYVPFTRTLERKTPAGSDQFMGISISSNGDRIVYGDTNVASKWYLAYWNGSNYTSGTLIYTGPGAGRRAYFNSDSSLLFLSFQGGPTIRYMKFNNATKLYDLVNSISMGSYDCHGLHCIDSSLNMTLYSLGYLNTFINYMDLSYSSTNYCMINPVTTDNTTGLTIAFWFRSNYSPNGARIFDFATSNTGTNSIRAVIFEDFLRVVIVSSVNTVFDCAGNFNNNQWYHVAITIEPGSGSICGMIIYINALYNDGTSITYPTNATRNFCYLGRGTVTGDLAFFGNIDDFRIYNSVLSGTDISYICNIKGTNNYTNSKTYLLYSTPANSASTPITPTPSTSHVGTSKTYYYWNDPYAKTNAIINKANPYNFYYTFDNTFVSAVKAKVSVIINDSFTLKLNGSIQLLNNGNIYSSTLTSDLLTGNNLFEFITYNTGSSAYFAAYVVDGVSNDYLFSTDISMSGWNVMITGFFSNGYPVSSLLVNDSTSTAYTTGNAVATTNYQTFNSDLSSNKSCKEIKPLDLNLKRNNEDFGNIFFLNYI